MRHLKTTLIAATLVAVSFSVTAQFIDGNKLWDRATDRSSSSPRMNMLGYVIGVIDAQMKSSFDGTVYCLPDNATAGQLADVVTQWLARNPQHRHESGDLVVTAALINAYPCQQGNGKAPL